MIISVFIPHGGCPERCSFCDQKTSGGDAVANGKVKTLIEQHLGENGTADEIAFYGGTFSALSRELQLRYLKEAAPYLHSRRIHGVRIATRPDAVDPEWFNHLREEHHLTTVELGIQSFSPALRESLNRHHSNESIINACQTIRRLRLKLSLHLMINIPGEVPAEHDALTLEWLQLLRPDYVRVHPLLVIEGTDLAAKTMVPPGTLETTVERLARLLPKIEALGIHIIRVGLQENELLEQRVLAGAHHPALGDLVKSRIARHAVERALPTVVRTENPPFSIEIICRTELQHAIRGHNHNNFNWLKENFNLTVPPRVVVKDLGHETRKHAWKFGRLDDTDLQVRTVNSHWTSERR